MAFGAGKDAAFYLANAVGAEQNLTTYLTSVTAPSIDAQVAEVSTFGDTWKEFIRTQIDPGKISLEGIYDTFVGTMMMALGTASEKAWSYFPQGSAAGKPKFSGSALLTSYETPSPMEEAVTWSAELQVTGAITAGTV